MGVVLRCTTNQSNHLLSNTRYRCCTYANLWIPSQYLLRSSRIIAWIGVDFVDIVSGVTIGEKCGGRERIEDEGGNEFDWQ